MKLTNDESKLRIILAIVLAILATITALAYVLFSNSISGGNIVTIFAALISFLTFLALLVMGGRPDETKADATTLLIVKLGGSLVIGILGSIIAAKILGG